MTITELQCLYVTNLHISFFPHVVLSWHSTWTLIWSQRSTRRGIAALKQILQPLKGVLQYQCECCGYSAYFVIEYCTVGSFCGMLNFVILWSTWQSQKFISVHVNHFHLPVTNIPFFNELSY